MACTGTSKPQQVNTRHLGHMWGMMTMPESAGPPWQCRLTWELGVTCRSGSPALLMMLLAAISVSGDPLSGGKVCISLQEFIGLSASDWGIALHELQTCGSAAL